MPSVATSNTLSPGWGRSMAAGATGINASSPRPSTLRVDIIDHLLRKVEVAPRTLRLNVVEKNRFAAAGRYRQLHVARNHRLVNPIAKEIDRFLRHLAGEV